MQLNLETILPIIIGIVTVIGNLIVAYQRKGSLTAVDVLTGVTTLFKPRDPIASNPDSVHSNAVVKVEEKPRFIYPSQDPENYKSVDGFRKISTGELYQDLPVKEKFSLHTIVKEIADEI
ncbi:MAG: hypothetical protein KDK45_07720, partial [Leptospiraceae bacterium]|nr:hypothetical protein [Leptospiraceae bacterium]